MPVTRRAGQIWPLSQFPNPTHPFVQRALWGSLTQRPVLGAGTRRVKGADRMPYPLEFTCPWVEKVKQEA